MLLGAIDIGAVATSLAVVELVGGTPRTVVERRHPLAAEPENLERLTALLMAEAEAARELGAEDTTVAADASLRGTRQARLIDRACRSLGLGPLRILNGRQKAAYAFLGATGGRDDLPPAVAVAHVDRDVAGVAVGAPGRFPEWVASRPAGPSLLARRARFRRPPSFEQLSAADNAAARLIGSLIPPESDATLLAVSPEVPEDEPALPLVVRALALVTGEPSERGIAAVRQGEMLSRALDLDPAWGTA